MKEGTKKDIGLFVLCCVLGLAMLGGSKVKRGPEGNLVLNDSLVFCGDLVDVGNVLTFLGPANPAGAPTALTWATNADIWDLGGTNCDAADSETESTADLPLHTNMPAIDVSGFFCLMDTGPATNPITFTLRSAEADLSPNIECTAAATETSCSAASNSAARVAAGATMAIKAAYDEDMDGSDAWCKVYFSVP